MDVSLITEGTYPFHDGGVSVWCDQLVRGMAPHRFQLHAITTTGVERPAWDLPDNVTSLRHVPLWGPTAIRHSARKLDPRIRATLEPFLLAITSAPDSGSEFLTHLETLYRFAQDGKLQPALLTEEAVELTLRAMAAHEPRGRFLAHLPSKPTVADAVVALNLLEHFLRPLSAPPPQVDLCHAGSNGLGVLLAMAAKWERNTPFLLTEHGLYLRERYLAYGPDTMPHAQRAFMLSFFKELTVAGYQVADVIAPASEYNRRWEEANGAAPEKIRPIYNGIDALSFAPPSSEPDVPTLAWVGRIDPLKDVKTLLRAFSRIRLVMPDVKLRIFGGTPKGNERYHRECLALHKRLGLGASAVFEGRVPSIMDAYHAGHVVLATSISEGFPYSVIEAMASGRAMIATDVGGVREAIADAGILVPPRDENATAEACLELLADPRRRALFAQAGRERVLSLFTLDMCLALYHEAYDSLKDPTVRPAVESPVPQLAELVENELLDTTEPAG